MCGAIEVCACDPHMCGRVWRHVDAGQAEGAVVGGWSIRPRGTRHQTTSHRACGCTLAGCQQQLGAHARTRAPACRALAASGPASALPQPGQAPTCDSTRGYTSGPTRLVATHTQPPEDAALAAADHTKQPTRRHALALLCLIYAPGQVAATHTECAPPRGCLAAADTLWAQSAHATQNKHIVQWLLLLLLLNGPAAAAAAGASFTSSRAGTACTRTPRPRRTGRPR
jgi:hypothetical protein